jgi:hypothetical protein
VPPVGRSRFSAAAAEFPAGHCGRRRRGLCPGHRSRRSGQACGANPRPCQGPLAHAGRVASSVKDPPSRATLAIKAAEKPEGQVDAGGRTAACLSYRLSRRLRSAEARVWIASYHAPLSDTATPSSRCTLGRPSSFTRPGAHQSSALPRARYVPTSNSGFAPPSVCLAFGWPRAQRLTKSCAIAQYSLLGPLRCAYHASSALVGFARPRDALSSPGVLLSTLGIAQKQQAPRAQPSL